MGYRFYKDFVNIFCFYLSNARNLYILGKSYMLFVAVYYLKKYSFFVICVNEWNEEMIADEWKTVLYINTMY